MKDVRPLQGPQVRKDAESLDDIAADDSWKNKINIRAVECCHEGIELSTPPFPFVQRWDPQQQRGYIGDGHQKRKGKKRKRNNPDYYDECSYEASQSKAVRYDSYQAPEDESDVLNAKTGIDAQEEYPDDLYIQGCHDSQAVSEQLLRETGDASAETLKDASKSFVDLPSLPDDPSTCPALTRELAKEGTVIAFKQLEMSAETNWQPRISEYQVAIINEVTNDTLLRMRPAKRNHPERQIQYDHSTGQRIYSKFEMPGYSDQDDGGMLEISFDELINPITLQPVQTEPSGQKDENSVIDGISGPKLFGDIKLPNKDSDEYRLGLDGVASEAIEPSEESRKQISELIKDAGWHSSIQSGVNGDWSAAQSTDYRQNENKQDDTTLIAVPSPKFNGFSSSPLVNVRSSPPVAESQSPQRLPASGTEIPESIPQQDSYTKFVVADSKSAIEYPSLPQFGDDSELIQEEAQQRSGPVFERQILSQDLVSDGIDQSLVQSVHTHLESSQRGSSPRPSGSLNGIIESEDEFPELFSQAWENRISQEIDIKPEFSQDEAISPPSCRKSKETGQKTILQGESDRSWRPERENSLFDGDEEESWFSTPRPSQQQQP